MRHTAIPGHGHYQNAVNAGGAKVQITGAGRFPGGTILLTNRSESFESSLKGP